MVVGNGPFRTKANLLLVLPRQLDQMKIGCPGLEIMNDGGFHVFDVVFHHDFALEVFRRPLELDP